MPETLYRPDERRAQPRLATDQSLLDNPPGRIS